MIYYRLSGYKTNISGKEIKRCQTMDNVIEIYAQMGGLQLKIVVEGKENIEKMEKNPTNGRYIFARIMGTRPKKSNITWVSKGRLMQVPGHIA